MKKVITLMFTMALAVGVTQMEFSNSSEDLLGLSELNSLSIANAETPVVVCKYEYRKFCWHQGHGFDNYYSTGN